MAKIDEVVVTVKAKMTVDKLTAEGCAKLLSIYCNENGAALKPVKNEDGTVEIVIC